MKIAKDVLRISPNLAIGDLPSIVAAEEGIFHRHDLDVIVLDKDNTANSQLNVLDRQKERAYEMGKAQLYNACLWGSIYRGAVSMRGLRIIGRRATVFPVAIVVTDDSLIRVPEELDSSTLAVCHNTGSHYMAYRMLHGMIAWDRIKAIHVGHPPDRLSALLAKRVDAAVLVEPYISLAEKRRCRVVAETTFWGMDLASDDVRPDVVARYHSAICEAVDLINSDIRRYCAIVLEREFMSDSLSIDDLRLSRMQFVYPRTVQAEDLRYAARWMVEHQLLSPAATGSQIESLVQGLTGGVIP